MKKQELLSMGKLLLVPVLLILLGLILMVNPDAATAVISRVLGYVLIACGIGTGVAAIFSQTGKVSKGIAAVVLAMAGGWLTTHPLWLVAWISRFLGMLIVLNSGMDLYYALKQGRRVVFQAAATAIGAVLILLPMTASRLVFSLCGAVVAIIGVLMLLDRLKGRRFLTDGSDPDIIDAL